MAVAVAMVISCLPVPNEIALDLARPFVSSALVPADTWASLRKTAELTPCGFGFGCIEARLDDDERVDLLFCASHYEHNRETLRAHVVDGGHGALNGIAGLVDAWITPGNVIHDEMPLLWVEVDHHGAAAADAFGHVRVAPYTDRQPFPEPVPPILRWGFIESGIRLMTRGDPDQRSIDRLREICATPPTPSVLMHLNVAAPRGTSAVRFEFSMPRHHVVPYLRALAWRGDLERVEHTLSLVSDEDARHFAVLCELDGGEVQPHVSLEPVVRPDDYRGAWARIFDAAVAHGYASRLKATNLAAWAGCDAVDHPSVDWPTELERCFDFKFLVDVNGTIRTKVYLVYHPRFRLLGWPAPAFAAGPST